MSEKSTRSGRGNGTLKGSFKNVRSRPDRETPDSMETDTSTGNGENTGGGGDHPARTPGADRGPFPASDSDGDPAGGSTMASSQPGRAKPKAAKAGKRGRPDEYVQANGLVRREVMNRLERAKVDPDVRDALQIELSLRNVEFKRGDPDFGAICEMLLDKWLETSGYGSKSN